MERQKGQKILTGLMMLIGLIFIISPMWNSPNAPNLWFTIGGYIISIGSAVAYALIGWENNNTSLIDKLILLRKYRFEKMEDMRKKHPAMIKLEKLSHILNSIYILDDKKIVEEKLDELETILKEIEIGELK